MQGDRTVLWVVISTTCFFIVACLTIPSQTFAAPPAITKWKDNKSGAASLTFDDGYQSQYSIGVTALNELGFRGTFFVITGTVGSPGSPSWDNWRSAANSGHEIGSHTKTHPHLSTLPVAEMRREILDSQTAIDNQIDSQDCLTFTYPFGDGAGNSNIRAIVANAYIGARGVSGGLNSFPFDFYNSLVWFPETAAGSLESQADLAETSGKWFIAGFHSLDGTGYGPITEARFRQFLNHIRTKNLWVDTFGAVTRYIRERESASLYVVSSSSNGMVLNLTDSLNDIVYDEELTIRSEVPSDCVSARVAQGGSVTTVNSVLEGSTKVIYFSAIPDRGEIAVTFKTLTALSVSPKSVVAGFSAQGTVTLSGPAPSGGVAVTLSSNSTAASVPATVTVPAGSSSAAFEITTSAVNSFTSVSISAAYGGVTRTATLIVTPAPAIRVIPVIPHAGWSLRYVDSQEISNWAATKAFDGNPNTFWHTQFQNGVPPLPHEIQIDLGQTCRVDGFRYLPRQDAYTFGTIGQYEFYVSPDGTTWGSPVTGTFANSRLEKEVTFAPSKVGRFIRLKALSEVNGVLVTSMAEINVLGSVSSPNGVIDSPTGNVTINVGDWVSFAGTGSDPDGNLPLTYLWQFGAGSGISNSTLQNPGSMRFNVPGSYTVSLTVTDALGLSDPTPATRVVTVQSSSPVGVIPHAGWSLRYVDSQEISNWAATKAFDGNPNTFWHTQFQNGVPPLPHEIQIDLGQTCRVDGFRYLPRQDAYTFGTIGQYEFYVSPDGTTWGSPVTGTFANSRLEKEVTFAPSKVGRFIRLKALSEVNGVLVTSMAEINVLGSVSSPNGVIDSPTGNVTINVGDWVSFSGTGSDPDGNLPLTYLWQFGAGSGVPNSTLQNPGSVQFNVTGTYTVSFTVTDALGLSDPTPATRVVTVQSSSPVIPQAGWSLKSVDSQEISNWAATKAFDGNPNTFWHTQFQNGVPPLPHEIQIDLGQTCRVDGFRYLPRQDAYTFGTIGQYEFYVSPDGTTWGSPVTGTFANSRLEKEVTFAPSKVGRFIRLKALSEVNGVLVTSMAEINILGKRGVVD